MLVRRISPAVALFALVAGAVPAMAQSVQVITPPPVAVQPQVVIAPAAPPPPRIEVIPPAPPVPANVMVWRPGHWMWDGSNWSWSQGQYVERPNPQAVWEPGHWVLQSTGGYVWVDGRWAG
jgi:hypothetical protein